MRLFPLVAAAIMFPVSVAAPAQVPEQPYYSHWIEAQDALREFANAGHLPKNAADPLSAYRREAERHSKAMDSLGPILPPAEAAFYHWRILPLHERAQAAMGLVVRGMETGNSAATSAGWSAFGEALTALEREMREFQ